MARGRVTDTEHMPRLLVGYTELGGGKLKRGNGFFEPNFGMGPNWTARHGRLNNFWELTRLSVIYSTLGRTWFAPSITGISGKARLVIGVGLWPEP